MIELYLTYPFNKILHKYRNIKYVIILLLISVYLRTMKKSIANGDRV